MPNPDDSSPARLLLVEDEPAVARLTELVLTTAGYAVDVVSNHEAAIQALAAQAYDLVLADTNLGAHTAGLQGLAPLVDAAGSCPVLLFTAHRFPAAEIQAAGLRGVISKPYDIDDLLGIVTGALGKSPAPNEPTTV